MSEGGGTPQESSRGRGIGANLLGSVTAPSRETRPKPHQKHDACMSSPENLRAHCPGTPRASTRQLAVGGRAPRLSLAPGAGEVRYLPRLF